MNYLRAQFKSLRQSGVTDAAGVQASGLSKEHRFDGYKISSYLRLFHKGNRPI